jgi:hypothetical protein
MISHFLSDQNVNRIATIKNNVLKEVEINFHNIGNVVSMYRCIDVSLYRNLPRLRRRLTFMMGGGGQPPLSHPPYRP